MATKTLILRPTSVTFENTSLVTLYPADTPVTSANILVNEEVADDDATYIVGAKGAIIHYYFSYNTPSDLGSVTKLSIYGRYKAEVAASNATGNQITTKIYIQTEYNGPNMSMGQETSYVDKSSVFTEDTGLAELNNMGNAHQIRISQTVVNNNKTNPIRTTQLYIEITYETSEQPTTTESIYMKSGDYWIQLLGIIYQKQNNVWVQTTSDVLQNNTKYIISDET